MIKICHMADIHIRPYKYMDEMEYTFEQLFSSFEKNKPDLIVIAGDTFHSKLTVSSEYFDIVSRFFRKLSDVAAVLIIPGNHDTALANHNRLDAISPVVGALNGLTKNEIVYSKISESIVLEKFSNICFHHFSIYDEKTKWPTKKDTKPGKINIALYHGTINGITFDNGWISRGNKDDIDIFNGFQFAFLGDIHKHQFLDGEKRVAYPGSLRQNNFSEDVEKGYLFWQIEDEDDFTVDRVILPQKRYFFTLYGKSVKDVEEIGELPQDCRIRFQATEEIEVVEQLKIKSTIESLYKPCGEVQILTPQESVDIGTIKIGKIDILHENIRLPESQIQLIKEYFKDKQIPEKDLEELIELDKKYHSYVDMDAVRNVTYKLKSMEFSNMFSFGKDNFINFENFKGLVGLFGENAIGKSGVIDCLALGIFNQIYKQGANKSVDYVNRKCKNGEIKILASMDNKEYNIHRTFKKKSTKSGEDKCDTNVNFFEITSQKSLNGETKPDTNKMVRNKFGTDEDFDFTSLCSQFGLSKFIDSRGTKRKEILAKYFDLDIFDVKYQVANEHQKDIKTKLEFYPYLRLKKDTEAWSSQIKEKENSKLNLEIKKKNSEVALASLENQLDSLKEQIDKNVSFVNVKELEKQLQQLVDQIEKLFEQKESIKNTNPNVESIEQIEIERKNILGTLQNKKYEVQKQKLKISNAKESFELLEKIPNVSECRICPLASTAYKDVDKLKELSQIVDGLEKEIVVLEQSLKQGKFDEKIKQIRDAQIDKLKLENIELQIKNNTEKIKNLQRQLDEAQNNINILERNESLKSQIIKMENDRKDIKNEIEIIYKTLIELNAATAVLLDRVETTQKEIKESEKLSRQKYIYDLYLDAMGKNGISYWIISKKMPIINKQVNFILSHCVNFKLHIEDNQEEKSIKIYILDDRGKRPIELGSGMEKAISSVALRAALWNICLLPKTSILILDEAFSYLHCDKNDDVIKLLSHLKTYFDAVVVITHDDSLKSVMDDSYYITRHKGYSKCVIN